MGGTGATGTRATRRMDAERGFVAPTARAWLARLGLALAFGPLAACLGFGGATESAPANPRTAEPGVLVAPTSVRAEDAAAATLRAESIAARDDGSVRPADESAARANDAGARADEADAARAEEHASTSVAANAPRTEEPAAREGGGESTELVGEPDGPAPTGDLRLERGPGQLGLLIPRGEELSFEVEIDLGALGEPTVGKVTLSSGAEPYIEGLPTRGGGAKRSGKEVGWIKSTARGNHLGYELDHELYVRHLPQVMPRVLLTDTQKGSENRRRKLKLGVVEEKLVATYEHDGHCKEKDCKNLEHFVESKWIWGKPYHCEKCKKMEHRIWKPAQTREIPPGTLDMLSAVYLARTMVREGVENVTFPLVDKQKLWTVDLTRAKKTKVLEVPAGRFECTQVKLVTRIPEGEPKDGEGFQGLFGIQGTIQIWFDSKTGVPVLISGTLPVPVLGDLDVRVELAKYKGTPEAFGPIQ